MKLDADETELARVGRARRVEARWRQAGTDPLCALREATFHKDRRPNIRLSSKGAAEGVGFGSHLQERSV